MCDSFIEKIKIIDSWECSNEKFRLVNLGAGPNQLQIFKQGKWVRESVCYEWGVLIDRVKQLKSLLKGISKDENGKSVNDNTKDLFRECYEVYAGSEVGIVKTSEGKYLKRIILDMIEIIKKGM